jgi:hypothetical protein
MALLLLPRCSSAAAAVAVLHARPQGELLSPAAEPQLAAANDLGAPEENGTSSASS